jgi:hypothetical protein
VFFSGTPVSSINKTDLHDLTEILLKVALNTTTQTLALRGQFSLKVTSYFSNKTDVMI